MKTKLHLKHLNKYRVDIVHYRYSKNFGDLIRASHLEKSDCEPKGGATKVTLTDFVTGREIQAYSLCSQKESFCRKTGKNIALNRAYLLAEMNPACPKSLKMLEEIKRQQNDLHL